MTRSSNRNLAGTIIAVALIAVCLILGVVGLVLPIVPGLLFLAIAALVAARLSPRLARMLERNGAMRGYLAHTRSFERLAPGQQVRLVGWLTLKFIIDGVVWTVRTATRLLRAN